MTPGNPKREFVKVLVLPALTFFLLPLLSVGFARFGEGKIDELILANIDASIAGDAKLSAPEKAELSAFYRAHPPSSVCDDPRPELERYRAAVCGLGDEVWQFTMAERVAWGGVLLGLVGFAWLAGLGFVASRRPAAQYASFMLGWRGLVGIVALETVAQGALAVWLSYWVTALLFDFYAPKLILIAVVLAGMAVNTIVYSLFKKLPPAEPLEAEVVGPGDAPALWARVKELAARLGTEPPRAIVAGIDDNFFVTEQGVSTVAGQALEGRVLYLSLPLLRVLAPSEADAVFCHELAHFRGGDTEASAKLYPALVRHAQYEAALAGGGLTVPAAFVMRLFRAIFEFAFKREQRQRELRADAEAARLTSPDDVGRSLLKVTGYSAFRNATERQLFDQRETHTSDLGLQARIDGGLRAHVASAAFLDEVKSLRVPHPFDSHPPLEERFANVRCAVRLDDVARLFDGALEKTWADEVLTGRAIEERLWGAYEARFKRNHEVSLAYRYLPATDAERALVVRHFPDVRFPSKEGEVVVTHTGVATPSGETFLFRDVESAQVDQGNFSSKLVVKHRDGAGGKATTKIDLKALKANAEAFKQAFGAYWQRDQVARQVAVARP